MNELRAIWNDLVSTYTNNGELVNKFWAEIERSYSNRNRCYHNLTHLEDMIDKAFKYKEFFSDFDTVLFSIFYHDIVYDTGSRKNEEDSADIARDRLLKLKIPVNKIATCHKQILATKEHRDNRDLETNMLIDIDLSILGEHPKKYKEYVKNIREEYSDYSDSIYKMGRKEVLEHFLNMERIFKTEVFYSTYEDQARRNLKTELLELM